MQGRILYSLIICLFSFLSLKADSYDFPTSRADASGGTSLLSTPLPSEQLANGSPLEMTEKLTIDIGYKRQYNLKDLDLVYSAISFRRNNYSFITGFSQLGTAELYTKKSIRLGLLYTKSFITIGNFLTGQFHDFNNHYNSVNGYAYSFSVRVRHKDFIISSVIDNINRPLLSDGSIKTEPKITLRGELHGLKKYTTTIQFTSQKGADNKFGIGESVQISHAGALLFGFSTAPVQFGGGLEIQWKQNKLIYTSLYHPVLGMTHSVSFILQLLPH